MSQLIDLDAEMLKLMLRSAELSYVRLIMECYPEDVLDRLSILESDDRFTILLGGVQFLPNEKSPGGMLITFPPDLKGVERCSEFAEWDGTSEGLSWLRTIIKTWNKAGAWKSAYKRSM